MTQEDLSFVTVNLRALYLGALAAPMRTTLVSTPKSETTLDGSTGSLRTANETPNNKLHCGEDLNGPKYLMGIFLLSFIQCFYINMIFYLLRKMYL